MVGRAGCGRDEGWWKDASADGDLDQRTRHEDQRPRPEQGAAAGEPEADQPRAEEWLQDVGPQGWRDG